MEPTEEDIWWMTIHLPEQECRKHWWLRSNKAVAQLIVVLLVNVVRRSCRSRKTWMKRSEKRNKEGGVWCTVWVPANFASEFLKHQRLHPQETQSALDWQNAGEPLCTLQWIPHFQWIHSHDSIKGYKASRGIEQNRSYMARRNTYMLL